MPSIDPNAPARPDSGLFGLDPGATESEVHVIPVAFDATTSYRPGTAGGPAAILRASHQVDLLCPLFGDTFKAGIHLCEADPRIAQLGEAAFGPARRVVAAGGRVANDPKLESDLAGVNRACDSLQEVVEAQTSAALDSNKLPIILGGDHSVPFGAIAACAKRFPGLGILHVDAHADLREAYEGFTWSHASILRNVIDRLQGVEKLIQVGIRDFCEEERGIMEREGERIEVVFDHEWAAAKARGANLIETIRATLERLPNEVYVTVDVDGLAPHLCPSTGTPVPGGLEWGEMGLWLTELAASGRRVVGMDLVEVAPDPQVPGDQDSFDAIVGARLLYRMAGCAITSRRASVAGEMPGER